VGRGEHPHEARDDDRQAHQHRSRHQFPRERTVPAPENGPQRQSGDDEDEPFEREHDHIPHTDVLYARVRRHEAGSTRPKYSPVATTARMPETPSRSAGRYAAYPVRREMVFSTSGSWMWRRTAARSHAT